MRRQDMITDITLDHLPDLSEASVSFQIPTNSVSADLLLADHTNGFDALYDAIDDDASFAPVALGNRHGSRPRAEATPRPDPRARSPTPLSSAHPPAIPCPPTVELRRSPRKHRQTPSRANSIQRQLESPLVSEECLDQARVGVKTLGHPDGVFRAHTHVVEPPEEGNVERRNPSPARSRSRENAPDSPPAPKCHLHLEPLPEEADTHPQVETPVDQDVVMATGEDCPAETTTIPAHEPRKSKRHSKANAKPTVASGGISKRSASVTHVSKKTKRKLSRVQEGHQPPPSAARQITPPQSVATDTEELVPPACLSGNADFKSESTQMTRLSTGGMAERLVSYSQKLMSSIGLYKPWPEGSSPETPRDVIRGTNGHDDSRLSTDVPPPSPPRHGINDIPNPHSEPFRLSEISPHKQLPTALPPNSAAHVRPPPDSQQAILSPLRAGKKRVSVDVDLAQECHRHKRSKTMLANADSERRSLDKTVSQAPFPDEKASHEDQPVTYTETCDSVLHPDPSTSTLPRARTKYKPKLNSIPQCKGPTLDPFPYLSSSRQVHSAITNADEGRSKTASGPYRLRQARRIRQGATHGRQRSGPISTVDLPLIEKKQNATLCVAPLTKPVGFTFRVDARLEARKAEERLAASEPTKTHVPLAVPGVKPLRASHQSAFGVHREGVVPSVPVVPFFFCTEQRAKEREKFDALVRRKEGEMERLKEEQRRREVEEEERAIKEMRRRAIPKANDVPEWYADMPKRKGAAV